MKEEIKGIQATVGRIKESIAKADWQKIELATATVNVPEAVATLQKVESFADDVLKFNFHYVDVETLKKFNGEFGQLETYVTNLVHNSSLVGDINHNFNKQGVQQFGLQVVQKFVEATKHFLSLVEMVDYIENSSVKSVSLAAKDEILEQKKAYDNWLKELKDSVSQREGAIKYSGIFHEESKKFKNAANWWLASTILLLCVTAGLAVLLLTSFEEIEGANAIVQFTATKVIITAALFYGINMSLKSYRAQKHNQILNEHRHNALQTFDLFQNSTNDDQTKNAVLMEVTRTIFGNQQTGYANPNDSDGDNLPSKIIEIIKQGPK